MKKYSQNQKLILAHLRKLGASTKYDLADHLKISIPTVTTNINKLISEDIIEEVGVADVEFGRKPVLIDIDYESRFSLGLDIQRHTIYYCFMNLKFEPVYSGKYKLTSNNLIVELETIIKDCINKHHLTTTQLTGIGISYPGLVDSESLVLKTATNMGISSIDLNTLQDAVNIPIMVGNEANLAAFSETIIGSSKNINNCLYISINEGIGGGIIIDKEYYSGSHHSAGEIGHMVIERNGLECSCGAKGCVEAYLSTKTLLQQFQSVGFSTATSLGAVFSSYDTTNTVHVSTLHEYIDALVTTLNNLYLIFDPECIIIGGEITLYKSFISEYLHTELESYQSKLIPQNRLVKFSALQEESSKLGACLIALQPLTSLN